MGADNLSAGHVEDFDLEWMLDALLDDEFPFAVSEELKEWSAKDPQRVEEILGVEAFSDTLVMEADEPLDHDGWDEKTEIDVGQVVMRQEQNGLPVENTRIVL